MIWIGFVLCLVCAAHCDFLLDAYRFGWKTWFRLDASAGKWGLFDFIPHDSYHVVQFLRNRFLFVGIALLLSLPFTAYLVLEAGYVITRGAGFSLPLWISKRMK